MTRREAAEAIAFLRETYPLYLSLGPVTRDQRQTIHDVCDELERVLKLPVPEQQP